MNMRAYRRNLARAMNGKKLPRYYHSVICDNGEFIVYDAGSRIIGRLNPEQVERMQ